MEKGDMKSKKRAMIGRWGLIVSWNRIIEPRPPSLKEVASRRVAGRVFTVFKLYCIDLSWNQYVTILTNPHFSSTTSFSFIYPTVSSKIIHKELLHNVPYFQNIESNQHTTFLLIILNHCFLLNLSFSLIWQHLSNLVCDEYNFYKMSMNSYSQKPNMNDLSRVDSG